MYVQSTSGFPNRDLWSESYCYTIFMGKATDDPLGDHQLIGCILNIYREEFYFVLLILCISHVEVTNFGMAVFDLATRLGNGHHGLCTQFFPLDEWS